MRQQKRTTGRGKPGASANQNMPDLKKRKGGRGRVGEVLVESGRPSYEVKRHWSQRTESPRQSRGGIKEKTGGLH